MNHLLMRFLCSILLGAVTAAPLCAQITPAWTRKLSPEKWKQVVKATPFQHAGNTKFINLSRRVMYPAKPISTARKYIYHNVHFKQIFSKQEANVLLAEAAPQVTLGKILFLHNQHAAFYNQLIQQHPDAIDSKAFELHQQTLTEMLVRLEDYYAPMQQKLFSSQVFSPQQIAQLQTAPSQPRAYAFGTNSFVQFARLPSLGAQQNWVERSINTLQWDQNVLLKRPLDQISPQQFKNYYLNQIRLDYLTQLSKVLAKSNTKRLSLIMRFKDHFLSQTELLTDAQRAGKTLFETNTFGFSYPSKSWQLQFEKTYGPYAVAEALNLPYEFVLKHGMYNPELLSDGKYLRALEPRACLQQVQPRIRNLESELNHMHIQDPTGNDFYVQYFRLYAQLQIYKGLEAQSLFFIHNER